MTALIIAALTGSALGAPIWIVAWEFRAHLAATIRTAATFTALVACTPVRLIRPTHGHHTTPRSGVALPTPAQIRSKELAV